MECSRATHSFRGDQTRPHGGRRGFSLVELLVVIATLSLLLAILLPALSQARHQARRAACAANLRQVGVAIHLYADDFAGSIPFGPSGRPVTGSNFYTVTGNVTSLLSLEDGAPVGLGLLLSNYLAHHSRPCCSAPAPTSPPRRRSNWPASDRLRPRAITITGTRRSPC
jgi:prepilin-type N-terminal cleavage/methylation domain-containing protein